MTPEKAEQIIRKGKDAMPAYENVFKDAEIDNLMAYLEALPLKADPVAPSQTRLAPSQNGAAPSY